MSPPKLHPDMISQVNQRLDLVDIVAEYVPLRKSGRTYRGACPFHKGSNQSALSVDPQRQTYHCFSCGASGNGIKFLMEIGQRSFGEVVLDLAQRYGVPVRTLDPDQTQAYQRQLSWREQLQEVMELAANFYHHALFSPQGVAALAYLQQQRQLSLEAIKSFRLGYAPPGWDALYGYLVKQRGLAVALVEQAGLLVPRSQARGYYDRFRHRIMIPICDLKGKVIAFGGRALGDEEPKYLNSPETELFHKGSHLFCLDRARDAITQQDGAIVVEGYFDAISLHLAGLTQTVASLGTALSKEQILQLARYTPSKRIYLNFDGDGAGIKAAERAIGGFADLVYKGTIQLRVVTLPAGKDADEFLRCHSGAEYRSILAQSPLFLDWLIDQSLRGKNLNQGDQFMEASRALGQILQNLPDAPIRSHYLHTCAHLLAQGNSHLALRLEKDLRRQLRQARWSQPQPPPTPTSTLQLAELQLLQIFLHFPAYRRQIYDILLREDIGFSLSHHRQLWQIITQLIEEGQIDFQAEEASPGQLVQLVQAQCAEQPALLEQLAPLLWLNENAKVALLRPALVIQAAVTRILLIMAEKTYRHWRDLWEKTDVNLHPALGLYYQTKLQEQRSKIEDLKRQLSSSTQILLQVSG